MATYVPNTPEPTKSIDLGENVEVSNTFMLQSLYTTQKMIMAKLDNIEKNNLDTKTSIDKLSNTLDLLKTNMDLLKNDVDGVIESQSLINTDFEKQKKEAESLKKTSK